MKILGIILIILIGLIATGATAIIKKLTGAGKLNPEVFRDYMRATMSYTFTEHEIDSEMFVRFIPDDVVIESLHRSFRAGHTPLVASFSLAHVYKETMRFVSAMVEEAQGVEEMREIQQVSSSAIERLDTSQSKEAEEYIVQVFEFLSNRFEITQGQLLAILGEAHVDEYLSRAFAERTSVIIAGYKLKNTLDQKNSST